MKHQMIKPYGDTLNDGIVQLSFTLPVEYSEKAKKAAELYASQLNLENIVVAHASRIADNFTFFIIYASAVPMLDYTSVVSTEVKVPHMKIHQINRLIRDKLKRKIVAVGAAIGSDAHTVGIDAIMNMKGYHQDYGLERYSQFRAVNMGAQVTSEALISKALELNADAILVSQTVTQKDTHIRHFTELVELLEAENLRGRFILVAGGPKITNELAIELGYDAGFGPHTVPSMVASYLIVKILEKEGIK
ncbi:MAG: cobalamin-dependent protein [Proteobacteria bacterium]|nr:cobalamin-dependent protein [Pseudomonadota bacterium]